MIFSDIKKTFKSVRNHVPLLYAKRALFVSDLVINSVGLATWYDNGNIEKKHQHLYTTVFLPGRLTVVYIYRRTDGMNLKQQSS